MPGNNIQIGLKLKETLSADLRKATSTLTRFTTNIRRGFSAVTGAIFSVKGAIIGLASGYVIRSLLGVIGKVADLDDQFQKLSIRLGITTETLSELRYAGGQSGVQWNNLSTALQRVVRRMDEFRATGKGVAAAALRELGGGLADAVMQGKTFEELLPLIADRFKNVTSEASRARISLALFDTEGVAVGNQLLSQGSEALREYARRAREFGIVVSREGADAAADWNDKVDNLTKAWEGFEQTVVIGILPELTMAVETFTTFLVDHKDDIKLFFLAIKDGAKEAKEAVDKIGPMWDALFVGNRRQENQWFFNQLKKQFGGQVERAISGFVTPRGAGLTEKDFPWQGPVQPTAADFPWQGPVQPSVAIPPGPAPPYIGGGLQEPTALENFWNDYAESVSSANMQVGLLESGLYGVEQAIAGVASGTMTWEQAWRSFAQQILSDIAQIATRMLIVRAIQAGIAALGSIGGAAEYPSELASQSTAMPAFSRSQFMTLPSGQHGTSFMASGPSGGYVQPVLLHGAERVDVTPLRKAGGSGAIVVNINTEINATDAESFDRRWQKSFVARQKEMAQTVVAEIRRRPSISRSI